MTTVESKISPKLKLPSLDGLRGISILLVIAYHLKINYPTFHSICEVKDNVFLECFAFLITDGLLGVNIFFVISGFLITFLMLEEVKKTKSLSLKKFYIRRGLRIFPAYYFYLFFLLFLQLLSIIHIPCNSWLTAFTYTKYFNWQQDWFTGHAWSLSIEELFYLFWPVIFNLGNKIRKQSVIFFVLATPIIKICLYYWRIPKENGLFLFQWIGAIPSGCLIALYKDDLLRVLKKHFRKAFWFSLLGFFLLAFLHIASIKFNLHLGFFEVSLGSTTGVIANLFIGIILLYSIYGNQRQWFRLLNSKVLSQIGILSYSLYLWQQFFTSGCGLWATSLPQSLILIFVLAMFSHRYIEAPFFKLKEKFQNNLRGNQIDNIENNNTICTIKNHNTI